MDHTHWKSDLYYHLQALLTGLLCLWVQVQNYMDTQNGDRKLRNYPLVYLAIMVFSPASGGYSEMLTLKLKSDSFVNGTD